MFNEIGNKIKSFAKTFFWIAIIGFSILGISIIALSQNVYDRTAESQMLTTGITIIVAGFVVSWIGSICLYGFGQLIDDNEKTRILLEHIAANNDIQISDSSPKQKTQSSRPSFSEKQQSTTNISMTKTNPYIDPNICTGCEMCVFTCPELFIMENNKATVISDMTAETWIKGKEAINNCPVHAIIEK